MEVAVLIFPLMAFEESARAYEITDMATVRDADSQVVSGVEVRLNGVDAPECDHSYG